MENEIWHLTHDFDKLPARDVLKNILRDDRKNYDRAESEFSEDINLLDDAIVLYIEVLQVAYRLVDNWKSNVSNRAAIAMLASTLNYILLMRHGVLLGYYPEVRDLMRSCFERISSCYVFFHNKEFAYRFVAGEQIRPKQIREELSKFEQDLEKSKDLRKSLDDYYSFLSEVVHPNLKSFEARLGMKDLGERVGLESRFGGLIASKWGKATIIRVLQTVLSALNILGIILPEESGKWDAEYQKIKNKCEEMVESF